MTHTIEEFPLGEELIELEIEVDADADVHWTSATYFDAHTGLPVHIAGPCRQAGCLSCRETDLALAKYVGSHAALIAALAAEAAEEKRLVAEHRAG